MKKKEIIIDCMADASNLDWIRAARLADKAKKGDKEAQRLLDLMEADEVIIHKPKKK